MDPSMRLPEGCVDCTSMLIRVLTSDAEEQLPGTEGGVLHPDICLRCQRRVFLVSG